MRAKPSWFTSLSWCDLVVKSELACRRLHNIAARADSALATLFNKQNASATTIRSPLWRFSRMSESGSKGHRQQQSLSPVPTDPSASFKHGRQPYDSQPALDIYP
jgi:hypothetical protein